MNTKRMLALLAVLAAATISACADNDGPAENLGERVDDAVSEIRDRAEETADELREAGEELGEALRDN